VNWIGASNRPSGTRRPARITVTSPTTARHEDPRGGRAQHDALLHEFDQIVIRLHERRPTRPANQAFVLLITPSSSGGMINSSARSISVSSMARIRSSPQQQDQGDHQEVEHVELSLALLEQPQPGHPALGDVEHRQGQPIQHRSGPRWRTASVRETACDEW